MESSISISRSTVQPENTYSSILKVIGQVWESQKRISINKVSLIWSNNKIRFSFNNRPNRKRWGARLVDVIKYLPQRALLHEVSNFFLAVAPIYVTFSIHYSIHYPPYLWNCTSYDHVFCYACKMMIYPGVFFFFFFFKLIFGAATVVKGQKITQNKNLKLHISHVISYLPNIIAYDQDFWYTCVKWWYIHTFFHFTKILIFQVVRGKRANNGPKW